MLIYKYRIHITHGGATSVLMGANAKILSIQVQSVDGFRGVYIWAEVDPNQDMETRDFIIVGTGRLGPPSNVSYLATVQAYGGVWHIYEVV